MIKPRHELNNCGVFLFLLVLAVLSFLVLTALDAESGEPAEVPTEDQVRQVERGYLWLFRDVRRKDKRIKRSEEMSKILTEESAYYRQDPYIGMSVIFHESSWKPGDQSLGDVGEWGLAQTHGTAARLCLPELKRRGIDPKSSRGQVICSILNINEGVSECGFLVQDEEQCVKKWRNPGKACNGALSRYRSGSCTRAAKSQTVAFGVARRLHTRDSLKQASVDSL